MQKTVLIAGLGLIGGSMAKAIKARTDFRVLGYDISEKVLSDARYLGVIDDAAREEDFAQADFVLVALNPVPTVTFLLRAIPHLRADCIAIDLCGVKCYVCEQVSPAAQAHGIAFIGGHPMAGREFSGFEYACADLYEGASMILVPTDSTTAPALEHAQDFFRALGFGKIVCTTAQQHDDMIAYTSQLAHVVSSAYIQSPEALRHEGYSAGSYKDLTRVARLNEQMWTELFLHNSAPLVRVIDEMIVHLQQYRNAIADGQEDTLRQLLRDGRERKERIG